MGSGEGGGGQGCGLGSESVGSVGEDRGEGCGGLGGGGLGANAASGVDDADGGRACEEAVKAAHNAVAVAAAAMAEVEKTARWQWRGRRLWRGAGSREGGAGSAMEKQNTESSIEMINRDGHLTTPKLPANCRR